MSDATIQFSYTMFMGISVFLMIVLEGEDSILSLIIASVCWPFTIPYCVARAIRRKMTLGRWSMQALKDYRKASGIDAGLVVAAMTPTPFTIADPRDHKSLDIVGFDAAMPKLISMF